MVKMNQKLTKIKYRGFLAIEVVPKSDAQTVARHAICYLNKLGADFAPAILTSKCYKLDSLFQRKSEGGDATDYDEEQERVFGHKD